MFEDIVTKWRFTPLRAYDETGRFIKTQDLESSLTGSLVHVYFELKHYAIKSKRTDNIAGNTFSAISTQVKILECGGEKPRSPYKSLMLKGPSVLPRSPTKKKDQTNTANTFKPGLVLSSLHTSFILILHISNSMQYTSRHQWNGPHIILLESRGEKKGGRRGRRDHSN